MTCLTSILLKHRGRKPRRMRWRGTDPFRAAPEHASTGRPAWPIGQTCRSSGAHVTRPISSAAISPRAPTRNPHNATPASRGSYMSDFRTPHGARNPSTKPPFASTMAKVGFRMNRTFRCGEGPPRNEQDWASSRCGSCPQKDAVSSRPFRQFDGACASSFTDQPLEK